MNEISYKKREELMQVVFACAANGLERESLDMITQACDYAGKGDKEKANYCVFISDKLDEMAREYKKKITLF